MCSVTIGMSVLVLIVARESGLDWSFALRTQLRLSRIRLVDQRMMF
jgi:hypothetical protein